MELTPGLRRTQPADLESVGEDADLVARIAGEIDRDGPMTFARFMDLALYDPDGGYYRGAEPRPGRAGDFITAPEAHPIFGRALARTVAETWRRLGEPPTFTLREYGAGTGALGAAILGGLATEAPAAFARHPLRTDRGRATPPRRHRGALRGRRSHRSPPARRQRR